MTPTRYQKTPGPAGGFAYIFVMNKMMPDTISTM